MLWPISPFPAIAPHAYKFLSAGAIRDESHIWCGYYIYRPTHRLGIKCRLKDCEVDRALRVKTTF